MADSARRGAHARSRETAREHWSDTVQRDLLVQYHVAAIVCGSTARTGAARVQQAPIHAHMSVVAGQKPYGACVGRAQPGLSLDSYG